MIYNEPKLENGIEIENVSDYLNEIPVMNEENSGSTEEICYRGQETEFWTIEPSIFRDNMVSIEHRLMSIPLQKLPSEFHQMKDKFEIMTKYQHYGLCTRLLDLTLNPLVALYFACKPHGEEHYKKENDEGIELIEPFGTIYFKKAYPSLSSDLKVKIVTSLAYYDLSDSSENTLEKNSI